jgi:ADP-ribosyl-[dinitrogen reductase] hydrolase
MHQWELPHAELHPHQIQCEWPNPTAMKDADRTIGSLIGLSIGDALGAATEFCPRTFMIKHPVKDMMGGGTWGLKRGQWTDDTSMALCLAISLIVSKGFDAYDQLLRYKWWYRYGYMSSTGVATRDSIETFERRQRHFFKDNSNYSKELFDQPQNPKTVEKFNVYCSQDGVAGNGALMRLGPVPLFFHNDPPSAVRYSGMSGQITHGDAKARDACRYYGALIVAALHGASKDELMDVQFYEKHLDWFGDPQLHEDILSIARGSYKKKGGYEDGIRGKGYVVNALEAALWAFWSTNDFKEGVLAAVNLGDDTDTTAAIYGQLAGAFYGYAGLPKKWCQGVYAVKFLVYISVMLHNIGSQYRSLEVAKSSMSSEMGLTTTPKVSGREHHHAIPHEQRSHGAAASCASITSTNAYATRSHAGAYSKTGYRAAPVTQYEYDVNYRSIDVPARYGVRDTRVSSTMMPPYTHGYTGRDPTSNLYVEHQYSDRAPNLPMDSNLSKSYDFRRHRGY